MSATNITDDLFQEAARAFRASLSPSDSKEFTEFPSAKEMIQELNKRISEYKNKSRLFKFCHRLERVSESLSPFFDIIGIFIQSNPEIPALVWGALRMVFLLTSNFSSFLDKLLVMFEKISDRLPGYAEYHRRISARMGNPEEGIPRFESTRVLKVLSYIYKDLVQFCQEACQIFGTKKRGIRYKAAAIADIFWKPFDVRFKNSLDRIETHQALFMSEMQLEESKFTESQFQKRERDSNNTNEAISQLRRQLLEIRKTIMEREENLSARFERISEHVAAAARDHRRGMHHGDLSPQRVSPIFDTTFRQIAKWINASDFSSEMNKAQEARLDDTGQWFLSSPSYTAFKSLKTRPMRNGSEIPEMQIMFIRGKPGYGKTILSSLLIDDLAKSPEKDTASELVDPRTLPVLYYHFASERAECCSPTHGLRACLHQIVYHHTKTAHILDAVSIITETDGTGQIHATDEDIRQCLQLLLMHLPPLTLVFDGLDECTTPPELFRTVYELCCYTGSKAIFLGRPNFEPPRGCNSYTVISLESWQNTNDIRVYMQPEVECLQSDGLLPKASNVQEIVDSLANSAQGMFLWARLVIRYLSNPWLSPRERIDSIFDDTMLAGLENLFGKIIAILERSHPARQKKIHRIFQAMAISKTSFTVPELRHIIAVKPGRVTHEEDFIVDFQNCLPVMCGSLVECDSSGHVRFIHSSFRDYIMDSQYCQHSPLAITKQSSWLTLTTICLSYLTYDVPRGPITRTRTTTTPPSSSEQCAMIAECFPLLRYGVNQFQQHDHDIFQGESPTSKDEFEKAEELFQALEEWIKQKFSVTAWIEANFFFQQIPTLQPLISIVRIWCLRYETHRARATAILSLCLQLEQDLAPLRNDWTKVLIREPCAIWTSTIAAFARSSFWFAPGDTIVTHLDPRPPVTLPADRMSKQPIILVKSQTAADKMTHATVHAIPSSQYMSFINQAATSTSRSLSSLLDAVSSRRKCKIDLRNSCVNWKAQYEIKEISSQSILFSVVLDLPMDDVSELLEFSDRLDEPKRFKFPVAISSDLHRVLISRTLFSLRTSTSTECDSHSGAYTMYSERLRRAADQVTLCNYDSMFSPMEDAIIFFEKKRLTREIPQRLELWSRKESSPGSTIEHVYRGQQYAGDFEEIGFLFHPNRPLLVFTGTSKTFIWYYNETETESSRECHSFIQQVVEPVAFENDVILCYYPLELDTDDPDPAFGDRHFGAGGNFPLRRSRSMKRIELLGPHGVEKNFPINLSTCRELTRPITVSQSPSITTTELQKDSLQVEWGGDTGQAVMIRSGKGKARRFGHIPPLRDGEPSSLTLLPTTGSVKILWDKELQHSYSVLDTPSPHLPCLIERSLQSVRLLEDAQESFTSPGVEDSSVASRLAKKRLRTEEDDAAVGAQKKRANLGDKHSHHRPIIGVKDTDARPSRYDG